MLYMLQSSFSGTPLWPEIHAMHALPDIFDGSGAQASAPTTQDQPSEARVATLRIRANSVELVVVAL
jgi:hypothetical protein